MIHCEVTEMPQKKLNAIKIWTLWLLFLTLIRISREFTRYIEDKSTNDKINA